LDDQLERTMAVLLLDEPRREASLLLARKSGSATGAHRAPPDDWNSSVAAIDTARCREGAYFLHGEGGV
jgi:hypothetical protein